MAIFNSYVSLPEGSQIEEKQCQSTTATIRHEPTMFSLRLRRSQFHKFAGFRNVLVWWFFSPEK